MGDEFGSLPGENKIIPGLLAPASDSFRRGRSIKYAVEFGRRKLTGIILKLALDRQTVRKKRSAPGIVVPSGRTDQNASHGIVTIFRKARSTARKEFIIKNGGRTAQLPFPPCAIFPDPSQHSVQSSADR